MIDIYGNDEIGIEAKGSKCVAYDADGKSLGTAVLKKSGARVVITAVKGARRYVVTGAPFE